MELLTLPQQKDLLRKEMIARLKQMPEADRLAAADSVRQQLTASPLYLAAQTVFCYVSFRTELATHALLRQILADGKQLAVPLVLGQGHMEACLLTRWEQLVPGSYGILEPAADTPRVQPQQIDLCLTPGLAFDAACRRLGRGAGYYDRFLAQCGGTTVALAYAAQLVEQVPCEPHDRPLDAVLTEQGWLYAPSV